MTTKLRITADSTYSVFDIIFVFLIAVSPLLQHYKGIYMNAGVTAYIIAFPYVLAKILTRRKFTVSSFKLLIPLIPFFAFKILDHGTYFAEFAQILLILFFAFAFSSKLTSTRLFVQTIVAISCLASIVVIIQYICYYIFHFHLQVVPTNLLLSSASQWIPLAQTGRIGISGYYSSLYRPSAFFLEPSHMFIYMFAPLICELFHNDFTKIRKRISILISVGILCSTSGMGIAVTAVIWIVFFAKDGSKDRKFSLAKLFSLRNIIILFFLAIVFVVSYFNIDFVKQSANRILTKTGLTSAVSGRTSLGNDLVRELHGVRFFFGVSDRYSEDMDFNMTGFNGTMYKYGLIGTILSYVFYGLSVFRVKGQHFWIALTVLLLSFFTAHTHGTFFMLFYIIILLDGYLNKGFVKEDKDFRNIVIPA